MDITSAAHDPAGPAPRPSRAGVDALDALDDDVLGRILAELDAVSWVKARATCRTLRRVTSHPEVLVAQLERPGVGRRQVPAGGPPREAASLVGGRARLEASLAAGVARVEARGGADRPRLPLDIPARLALPDGSLRAASGSVCLVSSTFGRPMPRLALLPVAAAALAARANGDHADLMALLDGAYLTLHDQAWQELWWAEAHLNAPLRGTFRATRGDWAMTSLATDGSRYAAVTEDGEIDVGNDLSDQAWHWPPPAEMDDVAHAGGGAGNHPRGGVSGARRNGHRHRPSRAPVGLGPGRRTGRAGCLRPRTARPAS